MSLADLARALFSGQDIEVDGKPAKFKGFKPLDMVDIKREGSDKIESVFIGKVKPVSRDRK